MGSENNSNGADASCHALTSALQLSDVEIDKVGLLLCHRSELARAAYGCHYVHPSS